MLPLQDVRILALEQFGAGPWATLQLAELGAEIIKIEDPSAGGDVGRYVPPFAGEASSLFFETFNRHKRSVALDLRSSQGRRVFEDLVKNADAVFSNLRGDKPAKVGIRYSDLKAVNPQIVCVSLSGFGMTGPRADQGAYDVTIQALSGWMSITGGPDEPPTKSGVSLVDFASGYLAAIALMAGIWRAREEGIGTDVDLSLFETGLSLLTYMATWTASRGWEAQRLADSSHQTVIPFQLFAAADGWLVVACAKESLWRELCAAIDIPHLADDLRFANFSARSLNRGALIPILQEAFARRNVAEWVAILDEHGVPSAAVNDIEAALADEQASARAALVDYDHPSLGTVRVIASPLGPSLTATTPSRAPFLGEHTADVLRRVCSYSVDEINALREAGAFGVLEVGQT